MPDDFGEWKAWLDSDSEEPYRGYARGPITALGLDRSSSVWTTEKRDSFYFSRRHSYYDTSHAAYISANRAILIKALGDEFSESDSGLSIINYVLSHYTFGLLSAWTIDEMLSRYREEISDIRDSSAGSQSAYRVASRLNDFLVRDGHDAAIISRDASRKAGLEYSFRETPPFVNLSDITVRQVIAHHRANEESGETKPPIHHRWRKYLRSWRSNEVVSEAQIHEAEFKKLVEHYRDEIAEGARLVAGELELTTDSISTSATLLQSMASIRLQRWSLGIAILAGAIAVIAIIVSS
ncbi:hypothetical protein NJB1507_08480 [Mycobacterium marinum]|nr:hypothetical protein NJB1507_08480 [Mycobacterium marinum]